MKRSLKLYFSLAAILRILLVFSKYAAVFQSRIEISTPLNSYKRVKEGAHLHSNNIDPYSGEIVHESPIVLFCLTWMLEHCPKIIPFVFTFCDLLTGLFLYKMSRRFIEEKFQKEKLSKFADGTEDLQLQLNDTENIPKYVLLAYLFNPFAIMNCVALTTTVISNLLLALYYYFLTKKKLIPCLIFLAFETTRNFYPFVLIAPVILIFANKSLLKAAGIIVCFLYFCGTVCYINFLHHGSWTFLDGTLGFIFFYRDLTPNIGLFWYFFTEMFEHFRTMFLITFQMNATILYLAPLTIKLRNDPLMLGTILTTLIGVFRAYPCLGDIALYLSLLPMWKKCWKYMAHNFVVFCFFLITISIMPTLWHLWIYVGSANANFYFGVTLGFCTGQIFLMTDLLFAYVKSEFCLKNGQKFFINGKEAKIVLE